MGEGTFTKAFHSGGEKLVRFEINYKRSAPLIYTIISCFFYVMVGVGVKMLKGISSSQILYFRSTISFVFSTLFMQQGGYSPFVVDKRVHKLLLVRCIFGGIGHYCYYKAFKLLDIGDAMTIFQTSPIFTAILAGIFLKEHLSAKLFISIGCSFIGILLVIQPNFLRNLFDLSVTYSHDEESSRMFGFINGLIYSIFVSIVTIVIRKLSGNVHNSIVIHYVLLSGYMISGIDMINKGQFNSDIFLPHNISWIIFVSIFNYAGQIIYSRAIYIEKATKLAPYTYSSVLFGFIVEVAFFDKEVSFLSIIGAGLVVMGNLQIASSK